MDWGSARAKESAQQQDSDFEYDKSIPEEVKKRTLEDRKRWTAIFPSQYGYRYGPGFAGYDLPHDRILVGVFVTPDKSLHPGKIDVESCSGIVEDFRKRLVRMAKSPQQLVAEFWFTHNGYKSNAMPANFEKDITERTIIVAHLDRYERLDSAVTCEEPIAGGSVTSVIKKNPD